MPGWGEIARSLLGAWRLARLDRAGMALFDISIPGFWRSFFASVLVAPLYIYLLAIAPGDAAPAAAEDPDPAWRAVVLIVAYALEWAAFPIAMIFLARLLGLTGYYVGYIIAANWGSVLQMALFVIPATLAWLGGEGGFGAFLTSLATLAALLYQWIIARTALQTTAVVAAALVIIDLLLGLLINAGVRP